MSDFTIYHNPRCSKSRETLALLQQHGIEPEIVPYLEQPPTKQRLKELLQKLGVSARDLLRRSEDAYKALGLNDTSLSDAKLIEAMHTYPQLIERPIVVRGSRARLGRPPENILELLD
jgi:arsenate reductase (glutaredoxin)